MEYSPPSLHSIVACFHPNFDILVTVIIDFDVITITSRDLMMIIMFTIKTLRWRWKFKSNLVKGVYLAITLSFL